MPTDPSTSRFEFNRRRILALSGVGVSALAGCGDADGGGEDPGTSDSDDPDETDDTDDSDDSDGADGGEEDEDEQEETTVSDALTASLTTPDAGDTGTRIEWGVEFENERNSPIDVELGVDVEWPGRGSEELIRTDYTIPATGWWRSEDQWVWTSSTGEMELEAWIAPVDEGVAATDTATIEVGAVELDWGESIHLASDQIITFGDPELLDEYDYEGIWWRNRDTHRATR